MASLVTRRERPEVDRASAGDDDSEQSIGGMHAAANDDATLSLAIRQPISARIVDVESPHDGVNSVRQQ